MRGIKAHYVPASKRPRFESGQFTTACGKGGIFCRGFYPSKGFPGEADGAACSRFEATFEPDETTCQRCKPAAEKEAG